MSDHKILADLIVRGDPLSRRRAMSKAITLLESTRQDHRQQADELLTAVLPHSGRSMRIGLSGVPGVGKSTLIESLGLNLIQSGHKVAVLAIDPSSSLSGGSILGDKTRMERLSVSMDAFIRPSPSSGSLGGVAEKTRECMLVCEAAGYDIVIVETVGVGQSESAVAGMTDMFMLMQLPNAGDDLQAIKKGVMELADLVLVNKVDLDSQAADRAKNQLESALHLARHWDGPSLEEPANRWSPEVLMLSALNGTGLDVVWSKVLQFQRIQAANGMADARRQSQAIQWMNDLIHAGLKQSFYANPAVAELMPKLHQQVLEGRLASSTAARQLLAAWPSSDTAQTIQ